MQIQELRRPAFYKPQLSSRQPSPDTFTRSAQAVELLPAPPSPIPHPPSKTGFDRSQMDLTVDPRQDFFRYAMGTFLKNNPIPDAYSSWGIDAQVQQRVRTQLEAILDECAGECQPAGSLERKLGDFYTAALDTEAIEAAGLAPVQPLLDSLSSLSDKSELGGAVAKLHAQGLHALFAFGSGADARDASQIIAQAFQGGLTLPNKDYYSSPEHAAVRESWEAHVGRMFELAGKTPEEAGAAAAAVARVETALAGGSLGPDEMRDPAALYNVKNRAELSALTPGFSWDGYLAARNRPEIASVNVATPGFFEHLDEQLQKLPLEDLKAYLSWQVLHQTAPFLSDRFSNEGFQMEKLITGAQTQTSRTERAVKWTDDYLGEALGQKFVERHFPAAAKAQAVEMVGDVLEALRDKLGAAAWMSPETKTQALEKLDTMRYKIGYPDKWTDYSALEVDRDGLAGNVLRAKAFSEAQDLARIGQPADKDRWQMTPATVNAYYDATLNEFVFPAAILQPPYFDAGADGAMNYGATGATIGHEITHGFDDEGSQYDAAGNLRDWWTEADREAFKARAQGVEDQFNGFTWDGEKVNGKLVLGESLADLGGLELAYAAYHKKLEREGVRPNQPGPDGFTADQRFFLSYAQSWGTSYRPEKARWMLANDPHPLPEFRVNGPLANLPAFARAFHIPEGSPMARPEGERCKLWD